MGFKSFDSWISNGNTNISKQTTKILHNFGSTQKDQTTIKKNDNIIEDITGMLVDNWPLAKQVQSFGW
jgi:hypothetical protein